LIDSPDHRQEFDYSPSALSLIEFFREEFQGSATVDESVAVKAPENNPKRHVTPTLMQAIPSKMLVFTQFQQAAGSGSGPGVGYSNLR
jgi:hypothetical protein